MIHQFIKDFVDNNELNEQLASSRFKESKAIPPGQLNTEVNFVNHGAPGFAQTSNDTLVYAYDDSPGHTIFELSKSNQTFCYVLTNEDEESGESMDLWNYMINECGFVDQKYSE